MNLQIMKTSKKRLISCRYQTFIPPDANGNVTEGIRSQKNLSQNHPAIQDGQREDGEENGSLHLRVHDVTVDETDKKLLKEMSRAKAYDWNKHVIKDGDDFILQKIIV